MRALYKHESGRRDTPGELSAVHLAACEWAVMHDLIQPTMAEIERADNAATGADWSRKLALYAAKITEGRR